MSQQIQITGGAKVRALEGVITGTSGVLSSVPLGAANGVATLDSGGKVPVSQLPSSVVTYLGTWNAATNTPTLTNGTGDAGDLYICNVAGTVNFGAGPISFVVGDWVLYGSGTWQKSSGQNGTVTSVAASITGNSVGITGSPISTAGTLAFAFAGSSGQYINGAGNLVTFPTISTEAQRLITEVYNETGATLTKGTVVYINGGHGNLPTVTKALATSDATSAQTYGVIQSDLTNMNNGYVVVSGSLIDLDTQAYANGTILYLSSTTAGAWTSVKQYAPAHLVYVAIVTRSHPTQGVVEIKIQNGYEMDELHNVSAQSPSNGNILQYVSSTSLWTSVAGTTTNISEGTNLYYTDARVRLALSSSATGLTYTNTTGVFSLTAGYSIPTTASQANWDTAYTNRITSATTPLSITSNVISIAQSSSTVSGYLSSTDWNTFNNKMNSQSLTAGKVPFATGTSSIGDTVLNYNGGYFGFNTAANASYRIDVLGSINISGNYYMNGVAFGGGTVNSVSMTVPTGLTVTGSPITSTGTLAVTFTAGYSIPTTSSQTNWDTAYTNRITSASSPLSITSNVLSIALASVSSNGALSQGDWIAFNAKMNGATFTSGTVPFATGTNSLGSTNLNWNGGFFGFGTAASTYRIDVSGSVNVTGNYYINGVAISSGGIGGSGTTNYLSKFTASTTLGNSVIYDNGSSVLIGTTDDGGKLVSYSTAGATQIKAAGVAPAITFSNTVLSPTIGAVVGAATSTNQFMTGTSSGDMIIACYFTGSIVFGTGSTTIERARFSSGGNLLLGIGTDAGYKLDVNGTGRFTGNVTVGSTSTSVGGLLVIGGSSIGTANANNGQIYLGATSAYRGVISYDEGPGYLYIDNTYNNNSGNIYFRTKTGGTAINALTIAGTGAATFSNDLSVIKYSGSPNIKWGDGGAYVGTLNYNSGNNHISIQAPSTYPLELNPSGGNVLIGTTTDVGYKLDVSGQGRFITTSTLPLTIQTSGGNSGIQILTSAAKASWLLGAQYNVDQSFEITPSTANGGTTFSTPAIKILNNGVTTITNLAGTGSRAVLADASGNLSAPVSDISVKQNIKPIGYGLNEIVKMNPVWFDFIDSYKNYGEGRQNGNIAQEMEAIIPEAVFTTPSTGKMGINYDQLHAVYIKAIQELKLEIEELKLKIK